MKRRLALLVCIIATLAMVFALASCGGDECEHTYSTEYTTDANGHWYKSTCGCEGEVSNYGAHVDSNNDGKCDTCKYVLCAHTYDTEWSTDENNHWNASNCDCVATKANEAKHADENKDGICDVCKYVMCKHTYSDWKTDETKHWKEATCGCTVANTNEGEHADGNKDGNCDTCAYVMCAHTFATEWSTDGAYHWHELTCGCTGATPVKEEHADGDDEDVLCDACGENICKHTYSDTITYDETHHWYEATCGCDIQKDKAEHDFGEWTKTELSHSAACACGKAVGGAHIDEDEDGACDTCGFTSEFKAVVDALDSEASFSTNSSIVDKNGTEAYAKFYDNYTVIADAYGNVRYYSYYGDNGENLFVIRISEDGMERDFYAEEPTELYSYSLVYYNVSASNHEDVIKGLYNLGLNGAYDWEGNKVGNSYGLTNSYNEETGVYSFVYLYIEGTYVYEVEVEFTVDAEYNGVATAKITIDQYTKSSVTVDDTLLTYTIANGVAASTSTVYTVTQTFGDPMDSTNNPNPYKAEDYLFTGDFTIVTKDEEGNILETYEDGDSFEVDVNTTITFYFDDETTKKLPFNNKEVTSSGMNYSEVNYYFSTYNEKFPTTFTGKKGGTYTLTFTVEGKSITLNAKVNWLKPETIGAAYNDADDIKVVKDNAQIYFGDSLTILSNVASGYDPAFTAAITTGADTAMLTANEDGTYTFKAVAMGTYVVTLTSAVNSEATATLTIDVVAAPNVADILVGKHTASYNDMYQNETGTITVVFTPSSEGATEGTLTLSIEGTRRSGSYWSPTTTPISLSATYSYTYDAENGLVATYVSGDEFAASVILTNYIVAVEYGMAGAVKLEKDETPVTGDKEPTSNPFKVTVTDTYTYDTDKFEFVADGAGKYVFTVPAGLGIAIGNNYIVDFYENEAGDTFTLTLAENEVVVFSLASVTKGDYYMSYTIEEDDGKEPVVESGLAGTYIGTDSYGNKMDVIVTDTTITFKPLGAAKATVWDYTYVDGVLSLTQNGNAVVVMPGMQGMTIENDVFTELAYNGYIYSLEKQATEQEDDQSYAGQYTGTDRWGNEINVTITDSEISWTDARGNEVLLTYTIDNGVVTVYLNGASFGASMLGATVDTINYVFTGLTYNGTSYTMEKVTADDGDDEGGEEEVVTGFAGTYEAADSWGNKITVTVTDTTITFQPPRSQMIVWDYTYVDGVLSLSNNGTPVVVMAGMQGMTVENGVFTELAYNGTVYTMTKVVADGGDEGEEEVETVTVLSEGANNVLATGNDMTIVTLTATANGTYTIYIGENAVVGYDYYYYMSMDGWFTVDVKEGDVLSFEVNSENYAECVVVITVEFKEEVVKVEDPQGELKGLLSNYTYIIGGYNVALNYNEETGVYYIEVTDNDMALDLSFTYTLVDNENGTFGFTNLAIYDSGYSAGEDQADTIKALVEAGTISANLVNNAVFGTYSKDGYNLNLSRTPEDGDAYTAYIEDDAWTIFIMFTYEATDNGDGTYTVVLTPTGECNLDASYLTWVVTPAAE